MPEQIYELVGRRIREIRKSRALSLEALADRAGLTASYIGQVERVERKLSLLTMAKLAAALDISPVAFCIDEKKARERSADPSWAKGALEVLATLPDEQRTLFLDTMLFVLRRRGARS